MLEKQKVIDLSKKSSLKNNTKEKNLINYVIIYRNRINTSEMGLMMFTIDIIIFAF